MPMVLLMFQQKTKVPERAKVTITASTNLSEEEIDRAIKEAQKFEEEDKKEKRSC